MYDSKQEASSRRRSFMEEFKRDAVRLLVEGHYSFKAAGVAVGGERPDVANLAREIRSAASTVR